MSYQPLQTILPAYPYVEYSDDPNIVAFFDAYNTLAQSYLNWFNTTPLAVYTSPQIAGPLLDWIGNGIYGIPRPVFSSQTTMFVAGLNSRPVNAVAVNGSKLFRSGTATVANDDYYKRVLTWWLYAGNGGNGGAAGRYFNVEVLRLKVARFLYGVDGTNVTLAQAQTVSIQPAPLPSPPAPSLSAFSMPGVAAHKYGVRLTYVNSLGETLPGPSATITTTTSQVVRVASPPAENGILYYNVYANILTANTHFRGAINAIAVDYAPLGSSRNPPIAPFTKQNTTPIPIGTNWTEPTSGLIVGANLPTSNTSNVPGGFIITVPSGLSSTYLQQAFNQGLLSFPFVFSAVVVTH